VLMETLEDLEGAVVHPRRTGDGRPEAAGAVARVAEDELPGRGQPALRLACRRIVVAEHRRLRDAVAEAEVLAAGHGSGEQAATLDMHDVEPVAGEPPLLFESFKEPLERGRSESQEGVDGRLARTAESPALRRPGTAVAQLGGADGGALPEGLESFQAG